DDAPVAFESRWALSYLRGPLTRAQIKSLMAKRRAPVPTTPAPKLKGETSERIVLPPAIPQKFIPPRGARDGIAYQPVVLGVCQVRFVDSKADVDYMEQFVVAAPVRDDSMPVEWDECFEVDVAPSDLENEPFAGAAFA